MKKFLITAMMLVAACTMTSAGGWEQALPSGAVQFGGYADVVWYNYDGDPSSFALNHMVLDASAELYDGVLVRAEIEWANQRKTPGWVRDTDANLVYAYVDYALMDNVTLRAGKFLLPFNVYNERLYRADVAKLASPPFINAGGIGFVKHDDTGVQLRGSINTGTAVGFDWAAYYVNGGRAAVRTDLEHKMGGRIAVVVHGFELGLSGLQREIEEGSDQTAFGVDICYAYESIEFRGEFLRASREESIEGFYIQAAYGFLDKYEVVARLDEVADTQRTTLGGNYKLTDDLTLRVAYEWNDLASGIVGQLAVSF